MKVIITDEAKVNFNKLDGSVKKQIIKALEKLETLKDPRESGKALVENLNGLWRYRVGDYRLICLLKDDELIILLLNIVKRDEAYLDKNVKLLLKLKEKAEKPS